MINNELEFKSYHVNKKAEERHGTHSNLTITFQVTGECNFRCTYCYECKQRERMNVENGIALIDKLFPIEDNLVWWNGYLYGSQKDSIGFDFFGGECTLEIDTMETLCQHFVDKCNEDPEKYKNRLRNFHILIETNGYLINTPKVQAFLKKWEKRLTIGISLDGSKEFHDACRVTVDGKPTWEVVKNNLIWVRDNCPGAELTTKSTITPENLPYLYDSYLLFNELGIPMRAIAALGLDNWSEKDYEEAEKQYQLILEDLKNRPYSILYVPFTSEEKFCDRERTNISGIGLCGSCGDSIALSSSNKLYTCVQFAHITMTDNLEDFSIGDIEHGINDKGIEFTDTILNAYDSHVASNEKCKRCLNKLSCEHCPAFAYKYSGDFNKSDKRTCEMERIRHKYATRFLYEMEKKEWQRKNSL